MSLFAFLIFPTGEKHMRYILEETQKTFRVIDIIRHRTMTLKAFKDKMVYMYKNIDPSKLHKAMAKIAAQGFSSSFVVIVVDGDKNNIRPLKRKIRQYTGCNCIHTADNPVSANEHLEWLLGPSYRYTGDEKAMEIPLDWVFDFSCSKFGKVGVCPGSRKGEFKDAIDPFQEIFWVLDSNGISYAVVQMGLSVRDNVYKHNKDIEIICSDRTRAIDVLGAGFLVKPGMKQPHKGTYLVRVKGRKVKLDFSLSVFVPENWRNRVLATRRMNPKDGIYVPQDQDTYWLTMFERVIYKPRKFRVGTPKYAEEATWEELVKWGINMGLHPQIRLKTELEGCQKAVREYMDRVVK